MKVKIDFVTNSSSASFILSIPKKDVRHLQNYVTDLSEHPDACNNGVLMYDNLETIKELQEYTNDGPLDWASLPGGPQFWNMSEEDYILAKESIEKGNNVVEVSVDYNVCERFRDTWRSNIIGSRD